MDKELKIESGSRAMTLGPVRVENVRRGDAIDNLLASVVGGMTCRVAFANANTVTTAMRDDSYAALLRSFLVLPDGLGVDLAAKAVYGRPFQENLNGTDFTPALLEALPAGTRVFLLGAQPGVASEACEVWRSRFPQLSFVGERDGYFAQTREGYAKVASLIRGTRADVVLVGMGNPRQEQVIAAIAEASGARLLLGVGALFDFASGSVPRAPGFVRRVRAEFLWRLAREPRRLGKRYTLDVGRFALGIWRQRQGAARPLHPLQTA
ncbi:WecB/TagA/CpsF family glycosyltransferase [Parvularcula dongshanensis]|uniref:Exopolysaccharide biosynthesis WecB/TagA/CpsF family protein n=1 Tax=Parvularcula dongshanensis TaxID=1173995 RepID=A0A840I1C7_9PROT|nr:WecB/TagA/CpsF family glycosyltransferase [Parvularcula dongshanensis]MBB4658044.1 exopolysaccharide biosynthesis WecB/TagA/CpsF family protein [Parvularcula dongshanensis]